MMNLNGEIDCSGPISGIEYFSCTGSIPQPFEVYTAGSANAVEFKNASKLAK
jgi:hypothetical protein